MNIKPPSDVYEAVLKPPGHCLRAIKMRGGYRKDGRIDRKLAPRMYFMCTCGAMIAEVTLYKLRRALDLMSHQFMLIEDRHRDHVTAATQGGSWVKYGMFELPEIAQQLINFGYRKVFSVDLLAAFYEAINSEHRVTARTRARRTFLPTSIAAGPSDVYAELLAASAAASRRPRQNLLEGLEPASYDLL